MVNAAFTRSCLLFQDWSPSALLARSSGQKLVLRDVRGAGCVLATYPEGMRRWTCKREQRESRHNQTVRYIPPLVLLVDVEYFTVVHHKASLEAVLTEFNQLDFRSEVNYFGRSTKGPCHRTLACVSSPAPVPTPLCSAIHWP